MIQPEGSFADARFERKSDNGVRKLEDDQSWSWVNNGFVGSKELNGLKVIIYCFIASIRNRIDQLKTVR